jgi:hypothetical protein
LRFNDGEIIIDTGNYGNYLDEKLDSDQKSLFEYMDYNSWGGSYGGDDYFDGNEEGLEETYKGYIDDVIKDNESLSNEMRSVGLDWDKESIKDLLESYKMDGKVIDYISSEYSNAKEDAENKALREIQKKIKAIIYYNDDIVEVKLGPFIMFIKDNAFFTTDRQLFIDNVIHLLENILEGYDVPNGSDSLYEQINEESWGVEVDTESIIDNLKDAIKEAIELFNADTGEDDENDETPEDGRKVAKLKSQVIKNLNDTLKGLGQDPFAVRIENDIVIIDLDRSRFHLDGKIYIRLTDKKTSKYHDGYARIKDIPSYFINYKLFEQTTRIKSLIRY